MALVWALLSMSGLWLLYVFQMHDKIHLALRLPLIGVFSFLAPWRLIELIGPRMRENGHDLGDPTPAIAFMTLVLFVGVLVGPSFFARILYEGIEEAERPTAHRKREAGRRRVPISEREGGPASRPKSTRK